jgi:hypothetical protein
MKDKLKISVNSNKVFGLDDLKNKLQEIIVETKKAETPPETKQHEYSVNSKVVGDNDFKNKVQKNPVEIKKAETKQHELRTDGTKGYGKGIILKGIFIAIGFSLYIILLFTETDLMLGLVFLLPVLFIVLAILYAIKR